MANYKSKITNAIGQEFVDEETGEITRQVVITETIDGFVDLKLPKKHHFDNGGFMVIFQNAMNEIAKHGKNFTRTEFHLLFHFLGSAGPGNSIYTDYIALKEATGLRRENLVTAVNSLIRKGIILKKPTHMSRRKDEAAILLLQVNFEQLNYNFAYNGKIKDYKALKTEHPPLSIGTSKDKEIESPNQIMLDFSPPSED